MIGWRATSALLACHLAACSFEKDLLVAEPPPPHWAETLLAERVAKDRQFREASDSPILPEELRSFRGLDYWPPDPAYRLVGSIEVGERLERFTILTTSGKERPCERYGRMRFQLQGRTLTLHVYRLLDTESRPGVESFFVPFLDATSGRDTYPAGRYVDLEGPRGGLYILDFNRAYNPWCAYGGKERYACPVTPPENRLPIPIEVGERGYRGREEKGS